PGVRGEIVIGEAGADVDGHRSVRDSIVERGSVGVAVEVDGMLLEQVRAHNHAHVGKGQEELVVLVEGSQRRRNIAVHHAHIDDLAGVDVSIVRRSNCRGGAGVEITDVGQPCAAWAAALVGKDDKTTPTTDQYRCTNADDY